MTYWTTIAGQERPFAFTYLLAYEYERINQRSYEADAAELATQVITAGAMLGTDDVAAAVRSISIVRYMDIMYAAYITGHRREKRNVEWDFETFCETLGAEPERAQELITLFLQANFNLKPDPKNDDDEPEQTPEKKSPKTGSTGSNS